jgi:hypothetical protein
MTRQVKRNHHVIPKLFLQGFAETENSSFIWVYEKGKDYFLRGSKGHHNPRRVSLRKAGAIQDFYSFKTGEGEVDFDTYENELEKLEKPSDSILRKLRSFDRINVQEKEIFAEYVFLMLKRVEQRRKLLEDRFPEIYQSVSSSILDPLEWQIDVAVLRRDFVSFMQLSKLYNRFKHELESRRDTILDSGVLLQSLVMKSPLGLEKRISEMTWQFLVAPPGYGYLTGDNPVFCPGLKHPYAEVSFPISSRVALVMTWHDLEEELRIARPAEVIEINRRTIEVAQKQVYYSSAETWVVDLIKENRVGHLLIYPQGGPYLA